MSTTDIEWTEKVWNPSIGCSKISSGCKFCYAETFAKRLQGMGIQDYADGFKFKTLPHRLDEPLKTKKPTKFFVNSMSDLFHEDMPFEYLDKILAVIESTPQHIYQILTKRENTMAEYCQDKILPPNIWLGVTVENAKYKHRISVLQQTNALVKFISFEPLIGSVGDLDLSGIQWAIVGGESGKKARLMKAKWVEEIFNQCKKQGVSFFFKQWGAYGNDGVKRSKKRNGRLFLNQEWNEYPDTPQITEINAKKEVCEL